MREAIFTGRSKEDALLKASQELGVNISEMTYEVLDEETGLFGLFRKEVRVQVRVKDDAAQIITRMTYVPGPGDTGLVTTAGEVITLTKPERTHSESLESSASSADFKPSRPTAPVRESRPAVSLNPPSEKGPAAKKVMQDILRLIGLEGEVTFEENEESVLLNVSGSEYEVIVGKDGEVLGALQFLVNKIVNRFPDDRKLVVLDAEGFRGRREQTLGRLARRLGDKAVSSGKVIRLSPMAAQDRRLIHLALRDNRKVSTRSEGGGNFRRLLIIPAGFAGLPAEAPQSASRDSGHSPRPAQSDNSRRPPQRAQTPPRGRDRGHNA
jgi:spoIIIJ-associated protein